MADALIFEFGADVTQFTNSMGDVSEAIKKVQTRLKTATGAEIPILNKELFDLTETLKRLKKEGLEEPFEGVSKGAKGARVALVNVSQVIQDLPFGFIGIQNNIPGVVQAFTNLRGVSGGVIGALKAMGSALIGPAGIFLGFSLVTSGVTFLISKYGSLGNAIDALFTKQTKFNDVIVRASESIKEFSKSIITNNELSGQAAASQSGQALSATALLRVILDLTKSEDERKKALERLKALDTERFKNFDIEKGKIEGLELAVISYTRALVAQSIANKFVDQVSTTSVELEKQRNALQELYNQIDLLEKKYPGLAYETQKYSKELISSQGRIGVGFVEPSNGVLDYIATFKKITEQEGVIQGVVKQLEDLNTATIKAVQSANQLSSPLKIVEDKTKAAKAPKAAKEKKGLDILDLERRARIAAQKLQDRADKNRLRFLAEQLKAEEKLTKEFWKQQDAIMNADANAFSKKNLGTFGFLDIELVQENLNNAKLAFQKAYEDLNLIFFEPLQNLFNDLITKGVVNFKDFGDAILKTLTQLATKIIASGILKLLANLMSGGALGVAKAGLAAVGTEGLAAFLAGGGAANFGGVQPGGMGMSGSVNLTLRGSDLVGAINRTNSQISRVG